MIQVGVIADVFRLFAEQCGACTGRARMPVADFVDGASLLKSDAKRLARTSRLQPYKEPGSVPSPRDVMP